MEETTGVRPAKAQDSSTSELIKQMSDQVTKLVRDELRLAQLEMTRKGKRAGLGIGAFGGAALSPCTPSAACWPPRSSRWPRRSPPWLAALIIGVSLLIIAAGAALFGKAQLSKAMPPVPAHAVGSVKADVEEIKESAHR